MVPRKCHLIAALLLWPALAWGQVVNTGPTNLPTTTRTAEFQLSSGNSTYGNNTPYATNVEVANEVMNNAGTIAHLSIETVSGGSCSTPPTFNSYVVHGGVQTNGTALQASSTQQPIGTVSEQVENQKFVAGDTIGIFVSTQATTCTTPTFDVDILITEP